MEDLTKKINVLLRKNAYRERNNIELLKSRKKIFLNTLTGYADFVVVIGKCPPISNNTNVVTITSDKISAEMFQLFNSAKIDFSKYQFFYQNNWYNSYSKLTLFFIDDIKLKSFLNANLAIVDLLNL